MNNYLRALIFSAFFVFSVPLYAISPLFQRAKEISSLIQEKPEVSKEIFHPSFLKQVPLLRIKAIGKTFYFRYGKVTKIIPSKISRFRGEFYFYLSKGYKMKVSLAIQNQVPYQVVGLFFSSPLPFKDSLKKVLEDMKKLSGETSLAIYLLQPEKAVPIAVWKENQQMAIGSAFKIYILGTLVQEIQNRRLHWGDTIFLTKKYFSHPSGVLHKWPNKSPVTLHTLASLMISISDNTATDHLLFFLGRKKVEKQLIKMGHSKPEINCPFLSTQEMFKLKFYGLPHWIPKCYISLDTKGKRILLHRVLSLAPRQKLDLSKLASPRWIQEIEWFASTKDLCQAMAWLKQHTQKGKSLMAREILSINPGLPLNQQKWAYVGYKGGSETGVLNLTYLLQRKDGKWFALSFTWNNVNQPLNHNKGFELVLRVLELLADIHRY
ncbi:MAG: hypothetical protein D6785_08095 [Planctomycetota bacterium]|nr:MAG: hypothetical protein D6785_08095 [Planctomycetota bacterium]